MMYVDYYQSHPLKEVALGILKRSLNEIEATALMVASKNNPYRRKFLQCVLHNYSKLTHQQWLALAKMSPKILKRALNTDCPEFIENLIVSANFDEALAIKISDFDVYSLGWGLKSENRSEILNVQMKYGVPEEKLQDESNDVFKTFGIEQGEMLYKNVILKPMEYRREFIQVGLKLRACTGSSSHWLKVKNGNALRFMILREEKIVGTLVFYAGVNDNEVVREVYGFEYDYQHYSEETVNEIIEHLNPKVPVVDLKMFKYVIHGKRHDKAINI